MEKMRESLKSNSSFWKNPVTVILCAVLLFFASQLVGAFLTAPFLGYLPSENQQLTVFIAVNTIALFGLIAVSKSMLGFTWSSLGFTLLKLKQLVMVVPAFIIYLVASAVLSALATQLIPGFNLEQTQDVGFTSGRGVMDLITIFISLVVLTPIFEEVIFRGVLFKGLRKRVPFWWSAVAASTIFAVAHGQWNVAVDTFALSLILCYLVEKTDSVVPAILLHALKNFLAFFLLFVLKIS